MKRVHIPRSPDPAWPERGTWTPAQHEGHATALLSCPGCGIVSKMYLHTIDADGTVNASIGCPKNCGYHEWGILDRWAA